MGRMVSIGTKVEQLEGMLGTKDLTDWEHKFISDIVRRGLHKKAGELTGKQVESIEDIWEKHFA